MMSRNIQKLEGKRQTKDIYFLILEREKKNYFVVGEQKEKD